MLYVPRDPVTFRVVSDLRALGIHSISLASSNPRVMKKLTFGLSFSSREMQQSVLPLSISLFAREYLLDLTYSFLASEYLMIMQNGCMGPKSIYYRPAGCRYYGTLVIDPSRSVYLVRDSCPCPLIWWSRVGVLLNAQWVDGTGCVITHTNNTVLAATFIYSMAFDLLVRPPAPVEFFRRTHSCLASGSLSERLQAHW